MMPSSEFYQHNRQRLIESMPANSVAIVASGEEQIRNRDVEYEFRAESDFFYLTGFTEPDSVLFLVKQDKQAKAVLFLREKDKQQEIWQGRRLGVEQACETLKVDSAYGIDELDEEGMPLLQGKTSVWLSFSHLAGWNDWLNQAISEAKSKVRQGIAAPGSIQDLDALLHEQRLLKSEEEIERLRQAAQISVQGHLSAMQSVLTADYEYQVQAELEAAFKRNGSPRVAFNSIVASADNACILHYTENSAILDKKALVLVDAGAEFQGYAGDITTTFPASGEFSKAQAALYSLVLAAQQAAIAVIAPGVNYDAMHQASVKVLTKGLVDLGILKGDVEKLIKEEAYKAFFMHGTGHWLGLDVHDVGQYKVDGQSRKLEPGMVITVEPGLYVSDEHEDIDAKWHNIGIRIEDDVLVTKNGYEVLTEGLPRTVEEIESWMQSHAIMQNHQVNTPL
ncbi:aminopeptidase P N-terminal domain-containing protein [Thiomicrorhabdus sediminis]|uniref:Xaa-Pro aminopeptidase n=1 Tax=Thiomicrorhabdus sediminis TaxID=2580412 RepID=A0A4P9K4I3_9GAMM|nr:aminopeptidase P N-terminal domain-containing protein [Thiomicrorhabdus sediminis]QCU89855.1 M24 family metallopeptidase [Thiomicrorhabdus sediminis]